MKPYPALSLYREKLRALGLGRGLVSVCVFGFTARGDDREESDLDLLLTVNAEDFRLTVFTGRSHGSETWRADKFAGPFLEWRKEAEQSQYACRRVEKREYCWDCQYTDQAPQPRGTRRCIARAPREQGSFHRRGRDQQIRTAVEEILSNEQCRLCACSNLLCTSGKRVHRRNRRNYSR
ncbi:hypothetical protein F0185_20835 [Massilia sp. CCM 8692]|uniref:Polymerase nucleotidyl transferase domain-containing protein n=1 Tax=Massilia rubra TaxID=2607910 RepID=A0ABX0LTF2_9BURK|nr:hypothetical protein [Massilia rubra]